MNLTHNEQIFVLWAAGALLSTFFIFIVYLMKNSVDKLDKIAVSMGNIETDFKVLAKDHENLKEDHKELKNDVRVIQSQLQKR